MPCPLASHDDTTLDDVRQSIDEGVSIAEFPTTLESAAASRQAGLATVLGAPNVVRGGSHSAMSRRANWPSMACSTFSPPTTCRRALLLGALTLADTPAIGGLPGAIRLVSRNPALATGLTDRGEIARRQAGRPDPGQARRAQTVVREVYRQGERVA